MITASFIVPVRNEEKYIMDCLQSLVEQDYPADKCEIIVVDGRSSDRTRQIVEGFASRFPSVQCLDNAAGIVPMAMNAGIRAARGRVILRADGHTIYPRNYAATCIKYLEETGADNVGGPCITVPADQSFGAQLVVAVLTNRFGVGDSRFRIGATEGFVDTVPFGAFRRELFDRIGMYNEKLVRNQDNELNARIRKLGGKIYQTPALTTEYHPAATFRDLLRQTFRQSQWHLFSIRENTASMSPRHFAPAAFLIGFLVLALLSPLSEMAFRCLACAGALYLAAAALFSLSKIHQLRPTIVCCLPVAFACFHAAYGFGTLAGLKYLFAAPSPRPIRAGQPVM